MRASLFFAFPRDDVQWADDAASPVEGKRADLQEVPGKLMCKYGRLIPHTIEDVYGLAQVPMC